MALLSNGPLHSIVMPLTSVEDCYGICVCSGDAVSNAYEALLQQISAAIRGIHLHRRMVLQVAMREKLDRQRLITEAWASAFDDDLSLVVARYCAN